MKSEIKQYLPEHVEAIMRDNPRDKEMFWCNSEDWGKWIHKWRELGPSYTLFIDDVPVMCAGIAILRPGVGEAWMVLSSLFYRYKKECFTAVRDRLEMIIEKQKLKSVQALAENDFPEAEHWLSHLGFRQGPPVMIMDKDMIMYRRECQ